jgi:hypothetical protein
MSLLLTDSDLLWMRAEVESLLPGTAVLYAKSWVSDGAGGGTPTYAATTGGTVACRLDPLGDSERMIALRDSLAQRFRLTLPHDAPITPHNRVTVAGRTYEIIDLDDFHSWNVSRRALVSEVR